MEFHYSYHFSEATIDLCEPCRTLYRQGSEAIYAEIETLKKQRISNWQHEFLGNYVPKQ